MYEYNIRTWCCFAIANRQAIERTCRRFFLFLEGGGLGSCACVQCGARPRAILSGRILAPTPVVTVVEFPLLRVHTVEITGNMSTSVFQLAVVMPTYVLHLV